MRTFIITLVLAASSFFTAAANDRIASPAAVVAFESAYGNASEVSWTSLGAISKVSFRVEGKWATAFYDNNGSMLALTEHVSSASLPQSLQTALKEELEKGWVGDLIVVSTSNSTSYYVSIETASEKKVLKSLNNKKWVSYQTLNKF